MTWTKLPPIDAHYGGCLNCGPRPVQMLLRIAYGTKAQSARQIRALLGEESAE